MRIAADPSSTTSAVPDDQHVIFLLEGLCRAPSPVLLVVGAAETAAQIALALHDGRGRWDERPARVEGLLQLEPARITADPAADFTELLAELASTDHWIYLPNVDSLLDSAAGRRFLDELMNSVSSGGVAAVIASTTSERLPKVRAEALRLIGFASTLSLDAYSYTRSVVVEASDSTDVGWVVAVRYELTEEIRGDADTSDVSTDGRLQLVDTIHMVTRPNEPPAGLIVGLTPDAFTVSQEEAAFGSAAAAAERLVGRRLRPEERVTAARGVFYG